MGLTACFSCGVAAGEADVGRVIRLTRFTVNHYGGDSAFVGWLVLQPREHRASLSDLSRGELMDLGWALKRTEGWLRGAWARCFPDDPLEAVYHAHFGEAPDAHLHFHVIPRPASFAWPAPDGQHFNAWRLPEAWKQHRYKLHPERRDRFMDALWA